jgi:CheY-like chemotaxis protein
MKEPRILVINDDRALIESRRTLFEDCGATVFTARLSEEALREIIDESVDLVLIDEQMLGWTTLRSCAGS